ncbi:hypothetical protein BaRGS_00033799 [Batillaria attramentaria]|uniref:Uncharacterized protein n=1 Tax=Batillaria attramentaria TaxID=370345 RepID=A0ABD0JJR3_9CAEN
MPPLSEFGRDEEGPVSPESAAEEIKQGTREPCDADPGVRRMDFLCLGPLIVYLPCRVRGQTSQSARFLPATPACTGRGRIEISGEYLEIFSGGSATLSVFFAGEWKLR